jgi:hypothetical protein
MIAAAVGQSTLSQQEEIMDIHDEKPPIPPALPYMDPPIAEHAQSVPAAEAAAPMDDFSLPWRKIAKWIVAGNPFYIISALIMLYGVYLVSQEPGMAGRESVQLTFNFGSLQTYEWLLVATAILLGRRAIWYDSTLLVCLENLFVFVPFILIIQASLMNQTMTQIVCVLATAMVAGRFLAMRRAWPGAGNLPAFLPVLGGLLLLLNLFFPIYFRQVIEMNNDAWSRCSEPIWLLMLPLLALGANALRFPAASQLTREAPGMVWLGPLLFGLWLAGTGVHLAAIDYVGSQQFQFWALIPVLWAALWTASHRLADFVPGATEITRKLLFAAPAVVALGGMGYPDARLALVLIGMNAVRYAWGWLVRKDALAAHLCTASLAAWLAAMPVSWCQLVVSGIDGRDWIMACIGIYLLGFALVSRRIQGSLAGAVLVYWGAKLVFDDLPYGNSLALQMALFFFLFHSLRWQAALLAQPGVRELRLMAAAGWVGHAVLVGCTAQAAASEAIYLLGILGCVVSCVWRLWWHEWPAWPVMGAAVAVVLTAPAHWGFLLLKTAPKGYLAVAASFALFGLGTFFALKKSVWKKTLMRLDEK